MAPREQTTLAAGNVFFPAEFLENAFYNAKAVAVPMNDEEYVPAPPRTQRALSLEMCAALLESEILDAPASPTFAADFDTIDMAAARLEACYYDNAEVEIEVARAERARKSIISMSAMNLEHIFYTAEPEESIDMRAMRLMNAFFDCAEETADMRLHRLYNGYWARAAAAEQSRIDMIAHNMMNAYLAPTESESVVMRANRMRNSFWDIRARAQRQSVDITAMSMEHQYYNNHPADTPAPRKSVAFSAAELESAFFAPRESIDMTAARLRNTYFL